MEYNEFKNLVTLESIKDGSIKYKDIIEKINNLDEDVYISYINRYTQDMSLYSRVPLTYFNIFTLERSSRLQLLFEYLVCVDNDTLLELLRCVIYSFRAGSLSVVKYIYTRANIGSEKFTNKLNGNFKYVIPEIYSCATSKTFDSNMKLIFDDYLYDGANNGNILLWMKTIYIVASLCKMNGFKSANVFNTLTKVFEKYESKGDSVETKFLSDLRQSLYEQDKKYYGKIFIKTDLNK